MKRSNRTTKFLAASLPAVFLLGCQYEDETSDQTPDGGSSVTESIGEKVKRNSRKNRRENVEPRVRSGGANQEERSKVA